MKKKMQWMKNASQILYNPQTCNWVECTFSGNRGGSGGLYLWIKKTWFFGKAKVVACGVSWKTKWMVIYSQQIQTSEKRLQIEKETRIGFRVEGCFSYMSIERNLADRHERGEGEKMTAQREQVVEFGTWRKESPQTGADVLLCVQLRVLSDLKLV